MQDWDRWAMVILGAGVAVYTGVLGFRQWRRQKTAAVGAFLLAVAAVVVPISLAMAGG